MAIQSSFYFTDGTTRTFPSTKHIGSKQHVAVYFKSVSTSVWAVIEQSLYDIVNQSIVFTTAPDDILYSEIEVRVADTAAELTQAPSDIALVAGSIANVNTVATNITSVNTVATNIAVVGTVSGSITNVNAVGGSIANVNTVATNITPINTVATNILDVVSVATTIVPNIVEILLADTNAATATTQAGIATTQASAAATSATNAQLRAWEAEAERMTADSYATEPEDVVVKVYTSNGNGTFTPTPTIEYSSLHWAAKAQASIITIDATPTDGSTNAVSSNGVFDALAGKSDTAHTHATYLALAGGTMTGAITALRETKVAMGANDIDLSAGNLFTKTISGATTLTVSNWLAAGNANSFILELTNGGSAVVTWFSGVKWASGTAPTLTASGVDILGFYSHDGGVTVRGIVLAKDSK